MHNSEKKKPAQLPKTIVGNTVSTKASHVTNDAARIYGSLWKTKKVNGVVIVCDRRIPEVSTHNATFITIEWVLPGHVVVKELNGRVVEYVLGIEEVVVGRYPTIKLGTRKIVSKRIIRGIDGRRTGMRTQ